MPLPVNLPSLFHLLGMFGLAGFGGVLFSYWHIPLPWMLGSMALVALASLLGWTIHLPKLGQRFGQITIGLALGLYFTPHIFQVLGHFLPWIFGGALFSCLLSYWGSLMFMRINGSDRLTSILASGIGAASDMATQAAQLGGRADVVAISHTVRVVLVVSSMPFIAGALDHQAQEIAPLPQLPSIWMVGLFVLAVIGAKNSRRLKIPNPWVIVPLVLAIIAAQYVSESRLDPVVVNLGQILLGWNLGCRVQRNLFRDSPRLMATASSVTAVYMLGGGAMCVALHYGLSMDWASAAIATAPGGISEMAITAKVLGLNPPIVTAFHATRMVVIVLYIQWMLYLIRQRDTDANH